MKNRKNTFFAVLVLLACACDLINRDAGLQPAGTAQDQGPVLFTTPDDGVVLNLLDMQAYKDASSFRIARQPAGGTVRFVQEATLLYTPDTTRQMASDYFLLRVSGPDSVQVPPRTDTITIRFVPRDSLPCRTGAVPDRFQAEPAQPLAMDVTANDRFCTGRPDSLSLSIRKPAEHGTLRLSDKLVWYTPDPGFEGTDYFTYRICNDAGACAEAPVRIVVRAGTCPGAQPDSFALLPAVELLLPVLHNDTFCGDSINKSSLAIVRQPANGTATANPQTGLIVYRPKAGYAGTEVFSYRVCSVRGNRCSEAEVRIGARPACNNLLQNDTLVYKTKSAADSVYQQGVRIHVLRNDWLECPMTDDQALAVSAPPAHGTASIQGGQLVYVAQAGFKGTDRLEYGICRIGTQTCALRAVVHIEIK